MARYTQKVGVDGIHIDGNLSDSLRRIGVEEDTPVLANDRTNLCQWLYDPNFVVHCHYGDQ
jgi:hypothetical protein